MSDLTTNLAKLEDHLARLRDSGVRNHIAGEAVAAASGETFETASRSPHLEIFKDRGVEVLLMYDRIDEWLMSTLKNLATSGLCNRPP